MMLSAAEEKRLRRAVAAAPNTPLMLSGDEVAALLGLTDGQLKARFLYDLADVAPASDAVRNLARKLREALRPLRLST